MRCSNKECCKQCRYVKFKGTMTKYTYTYLHLICHDVVSWIDLTLTVFQHWIGYIMSASPHLFFVSPLLNYILSKPLIAFLQVSSRKQLKQALNNIVLNTHLLGLFFLFNFKIWQSKQPHLLL